jgi:hypothetical protein
MISSVVFVTQRGINPKSPSRKGVEWPGFA